MTSFEPVQAGPYLTPSDPPDLANISKAVVDWAAGRLNMRFATTAARDAAIPAPVEGMYCITGTGATLVRWLYVSAAWFDIRPTGITMGTPTTTATNGTTSVAATETLDAVLGNYTFTALAGRRYRVAFTGMGPWTSVAGDVFKINIRNGGASTPTAASPLIVTATIPVALSGGSGAPTVPVLGTFVPGAGTVTLGVFVLRYVGTGTAIPTGNRELYVVDLGPA